MYAKLKAAEQQQNENKMYVVIQHSRKGDEKVEYAQDGWAGYPLGGIPQQ